ncbi:MAG: TolC family protein [Rhodospirillaceae bacterium]|nr:MAG: TolC family protein [Rhodospirillaceae bacterium]
MGSMPYRWRAALGVLGTGLVLGACGTPRVDPPPDPHASAAAFAARKLNDAGLAQFMGRLGVSTPASNDLTPELVIAAALYFHADAKRAAADIAAAHADVEVASEMPNPVLSLSPARVIHATASEVPWVVAAVLSLPVETNGKRSRRTAAAQSAEQQAVLSAGTTLWQVRSRALKALQDLCDVEDEVRADAEEAALDQALTERFVKQQQAGLTSMIDTLRAQGDRAQAESKLADARARLTGARGDLADAMGVPLTEIADRHAAPWPERAHAPTLDPARLDELQADAIVNRTDLRAQLAAYAQASATWQLEVAKRIPDVTVGPGYTYDRGDKEITLDVSFELPVFHGNGAAIARAKADRDRAAAAFEGTQGDVIASVQKSRAALEGAVLAFQQSDAAMRAAEATQSRVEKEMHRNLVSKPELMQASLVRVQATQAHLAAAHQLHAAMAAMEDAVEAPIWTPSLNLAAALPPSMSERGDQR